MKIQPASGLSPEEIERIVQDAKKYEEEDKNELRLTKAKMQLKEEAETVKFYYQRYIEKLTPHDSAEIDSLLGRCEKALEGNDTDLIEGLLKKMKNYRMMINTILTSEFSK
jgi:molecular chaperone DnaK